MYCQGRVEFPMLSSAAAFWHNLSQKVGVSFKVDLKPDLRLQGISKFRKSYPPHSVIKKELTREGEVKINCSC